MTCKKQYNYLHDIVLVPGASGAAFAAPAEEITSAQYETYPDAASSSPGSSSAAMEASAPDYP